MPVIGILGLENPPFVSNFRRGLADAGYVPGQNLAIEFRWANYTSLLPQLAADLVNRKVDVIVTTGSTPAGSA
jgi:putative ABC transport system substrate-binding protein